MATKNGVESVVELIGSSIKGLEVAKDDPKAQRMFVTVPLSKVVPDSDIRGIRHGDAYKDADFKGLLASISADSMMNPIHCWWDREKGILIAFGGTRRLAALKGMTQKPKDEGGIAEDSPVDVFVWYNLDKITARKQAMTDNSYRKQFTDTERLRAIDLMEKGNFTIETMIEAMGLSKDTINRYRSILHHPLLKELLAANETGGDGLPYTLLSKLGDYADKHADWITEILLNWREKATRQRDEYRQKCELNGRKPQGSKLRLSSYLAGALLTSWITDLGLDKKPAGKISPKKVNFDASSDTIKVDGMNMDLRKATAQQITDVTLMYRKVTKQLEAAVAAKKAGQLEDSEDYRESEEYREEYRRLMGEDPGTIVHGDDDGDEDAGADDDGEAEEVA